MFGAISRVCFAVIIFLMIGGLEPVSAGQIEGKILGLNKDRLVFGVGTDDLVFANSRFMIMSSLGDTVYSDTIEAATNEISFSHKLDGALDSNDLDSCLAFIETAEIAANLVLNIFCLKALPVNLTSGLEKRVPVETNHNQFINHWSSRSAGISLNYLSHESELWSQGSIRPENLIAYRLPQSIANLIEHTSVPAPFFAALVPNINRQVNNNAFLTTSLYYRFNDKHLSQLFDGQDPSTFTALYGRDSSRVRWYPFNPRQGKKLFDRIDDRPREMSIGVKDPALHQLALYFADILARDKQRVRIATEGQEADVYLMFVPHAQTNPTVSLEFLYNQLLETNTGQRSYREALAQIRIHLERLPSTTDSTQSLNYLRRIDQIMKEDLGVFPLFQPTLYLVTKPDYSNVRFDENNYLDFEKMIMLHLPGSAR